MEAAVKIYAQLGSCSDLGLPCVEGDKSALQNILSTVFLVIGAIAVIVIVYGGLRYVLSAGTPDETKKAKDIIVYAIVGLVVSLSAFTIVNFVASSF